MLKINKDKIIADGMEKSYDNITVMTLARNYLSFSGGIADCVQYDGKIKDVYNALLDAGITGFILHDNNLININNIQSSCIDFYQYAGISIHQCSKDNAELYHLKLMCKNGKTETIPFRTFNEAEDLHFIINNALIELSSEEVNIANN